MRKVTIFKYQPIYPRFMTKPKCIDHVLNKIQVEELKNKCESSKEKLALYGLLYTGMRVSEFLHIQRDWIDFKNETITVPLEMKCSCHDCTRELKSKKGRITKDKGQWKPKTTSGSRTIRILPELIPLFNEYFKNHESIMELFKNRIEIWRTVKRVHRKTTIKNIFPHSIRSTYASLIAEFVDNPLDLKDMMGWRSLDMAQHYIKMSKERAKKISERFVGKW